MTINHNKMKKDIETINVAYATLAKLEDIRKEIKFHKEKIALLDKELDEVFLSLCSLTNTKFVE